MRRAVTVWIGYISRERTVAMRPPKLSIYVVEIADKNAKCHHDTSSLGLIKLPSEL